MVVRGFIGGETYGPLGLGLSGASRATVTTGMLRGTQSNAGEAVWCPSAAGRDTTKSDLGRPRISPWNWDRALR